MVLAANNLMGNQFHEAKEFYLDVVAYINNNPEKFNATNTTIEDINLTGHSLGGGLAQIMGAIYHQNTVTFNALGMENLYNEYLSSPTFHFLGVNFSNQFKSNKQLIGNFIINGDFVSNSYNHIGSTWYATLGSTGVLSVETLLNSTVPNPLQLFNAYVNSVGLHNIPIETIDTNNDHIPDDLRLLNINDFKTTGPNLESEMFFQIRQQLLGNTPYSGGNDIVKIQRKSRK